MVTSGIWRDIELVAFDTARLTDVMIQQHHSTAAGVTARSNLRLNRYRCARDGCHHYLKKQSRSLRQPRILAFTGDAAETSITIPNPELWWVQNLGDQPLYTVEVTLRDADGKTLDTWTKRIGLRTLTLERHR